MRASAHRWVLWALYATVAYAALVSALLLVDAIQDRDDPLSSGMAGVLAAASGLAFYVAVGIFARRIVEARARRRWFAAGALGSFAMIVVSGGPGGLFVFGPATVMLTVLAVRR